MEEQVTVVPENREKDQWGRASSGPSRVGPSASRRRTRWRPGVSGCAGRGVPSCCGRPVGLLDVGLCPAPRSFGGCRRVGEWSGEKSYRVNKY